MVFIFVLMTYQVDILYNPFIMNFDFLPNDPAILKGLIVDLSAQKEADLAHYKTRWRIRSHISVSSKSRCVS